MSDAQPMSRRDEWLEFWERRELRFVVALGYVLLVLSLGLDLGSRGGATAGLRVDAALVAALAALMVGLDLGPYKWSTHGAGVRPPAAGGAPGAWLAFGAWLALAGALVIRQPLYGFFSFTGYFWAFRLLRGRGRMVGVAFVAMLSAISQTGSFPYSSASRVAGLVVIYLINVGVAGSLTWFGWVSDEQQQRRAHRISALAETNAKLEASLKRNAELQERLLAQARDAGIAQERSRMAREIHDTLAQGLAGILTQLQAAQAQHRVAVPAAADTARASRGVADHGPDAAAHVATAIELARDSLAEARRSVAALRPLQLTGARLPDAVRDVAARWSHVNALPVSVTTTGTARVMEPEVEVALLRTAQEALANVAKHAGATRVGVTLSYMEDVVTLDVVDDGVGFGSTPPSPGGFGLESMRHRVESVEGTLLVESEPDRGTAVSASVPVEVA